jgi:PAS domain S-box-containing protein
MKRFPVGFFDRLEMKFLKIVLPIILVSASLFFAIIEGFSATRAIEELNTNQQILAQRYSILISSWVWNLDRERIKMSLETLITDKSIVGAQVVNERGGELASAGIVLEEGRDLSTTVDIFFETDSDQILVGRATIFATDRFVKEQVLHQLLHDGSLVLLILVPTIIVSIYANRKTVTVPLSRMMVVIQQAVDSNLPEPIDWDSSDEIGAIVESFNNLMSKRKEALREKEKLERELNYENEQNIKRTAELILANDLRQLIDTANAPIFGVDAQGRVNEWNLKAREITGFTKAEVSGRDLVANFVTDDYKDAIGVILDKALNGEKIANYETSLLTKSGNKIDVLFNASTRRDASGQTVGVIGVGQDITELNKVRDEQERERKDAAATLRSIIENIPVGLLIKDRNHMAVLVNNTYLEWYGLKSASVLGKPIGKIEGEGFRSEHEVALTTRQEKEVMTTGRTVQRQVERTFTDSKVHTVRITKFPIFDQDGLLVAVGSSSVDMTEQVETQQKLSVALEEIKTTQSEIIQASKLATLGEMATSVAHELNQPLNVIRMAAANARRKISKGTADPEYLNDKLVRIEDQTARAAAIIDHMRMFGRNAKEESEPVDPRKMVTNALGLVGEQLRLAGIEIVTELPQDCSLISGHPILIEQVLLNLLTNARDAMAERDGESKITLRVFEDDEGVHITSEDTGGGIPEDVLGRIFEPFYTTKEIGKGTGLGLSVSYGIIRDMNGTIVADNTDDGARFTINFPIVS